MRKLRLFLTLLALIGAYVAKADVVTQTIDNYVFDFNNLGTINTNDQTLSLGPGWTRIYDTSSYYNTIAYASDTSYGVDGSGCLSISNQSSSSYYDLIVTPKVSGTVTLQVKRKSYTTGIKFYEVTENAAGKLTKGEEITPTTSGELTSYQQFVTYTISLAAEKRIGIRGDGVYIDDFKATQASVAYNRTVKVDEATLVGNADADAEGNVSLTLKAKVINNGDLDIAPGDVENFSLSLINRSDNDAVLATMPITETIAAGEVRYFDVKATFPISRYPGNNQYSIRDNFCQTMPYGTWVTPTSYEAVFAIYEQFDDEAITANAVVNFGVSNEDVTKTFVIKNSGASVLNITAMTLPEGFTVDTEAPFAVEAHGERNIQVTMVTSVAPGDYFGAFVVTSNAADFTATLAGTVLDPEKWYAPMATKEVPADTYNKGWTADGTADNYYLKSTSAASVFATPLLTAGDNDSFRFDVRRNDDNSTLKVYVSTDRQTLSLLKEINADEMADDFKTVTVQVPAGNAYIVFEGAAQIDNLYGLHLAEVAHDLMVTAENLPTSAEVNNRVTASYSVQNTLTAEVTAADYTVKYYVNGEEVAVAEPTELPYGVNKTFTLSYMPYSEGTFDTYIELLFTDGTSYRSQTVDLNVTGEKAKGETIVGNATNWGNQQPLYLYYAQSESEVVYTPDELGITNGTKIKQIIYKGYSKVAGSAPVRVWLQNTTDTAPLMVQGALDTSDMTKVFDGTVSIEEAGDRSEEKQVDVMVITLGTPFEYTGGNLRVYVNSEAGEGIGGQVYFAYSTTKNGKIRKKAAGQDMANTTPSNVQGNPVMGLIYDKETSYFTGTLTIENVDGTNTPVADTRIILTADDGVRYEGTSDADGSYSIAVMQDAKTYAITVDYTAKSIFPVTDKAVFKGATLRQDITLAEAVDFFIDDYTPKEATITANHRYTEASVTATNYNAEAMQAGAYTVKLFFGDKEVAAAEAVEIGANETLTYNFTFTPHETGTFTAHYELTGTVKPSPVRSADFNITVNPETAAGGEVQVLDAETPSAYAYRAPFELNYNHSMSETVYTAEELGLSDGTAILSISYKSYRSSAKSIPTQLKVWIENTNDGLDFTPGRDVSEMTLVFDGDKTITQHGSSSEYVKYFTFQLETPFVYTGGNIRIVTQADASDYADVNYERDSKYSGSYVKQNDNTSDITKESWGTARQYSPTLYLTIDGSKHFTGIAVDEEENPVAGAVVTLTNEECDVIYSATADDEGKFDVTVAQKELDYMVTAGKDDLSYQGAEAVSLSDGNIENQTLVLVKALVGDVNMDGKVNVDDIVALASHIRGITPATFNLNAADVNEDEVVNVDDIVRLAAIIRDNDANE